MRFAEDRKHAANTTTLSLFNRFGLLWFIYLQFSLIFADPISLLGLDLTRDEAAESSHPCSNTHSSKGEGT